MQLLCKLKTMLILKIRREREKKKSSLSLFFFTRKNFDKFEIPSDLIRMLRAAMTERKLESGEFHVRANENKVTGS